MKIKENIDVLFERFESFIKNQTIIGQEIKIGEITIIPLANISFGMGTGGSPGTEGKGGEGGAGMFAKASPTALLVVNNGAVNLVPIRKGSSFDSLLESVPALVEKLSEQNFSKDKNNEEPSEESKEDDTK